MSCYDFQDGNCRRGERCRFTHDGSANRVRAREGGNREYVEDRSEGSYGRRQDFPGNNRGRGGYQGEREGLGSNSQGGRHEGGPVCYDWQDGNCRRGDSCRFSHNDGRKVNQRQGYRHSSDNVANFESGVPGDNFGGGSEKGKCFDFQKGNCRRGDRCRFSHDEYNRERGQRVGERVRNRGNVAGRSVDGSSDGVVVRLNEKGFGFIKESNGGKDIFFHSSGMKDAGSFDQLREGDRVSFEKSWDDRQGKSRAENVQF